jgi:hypothetical protein
MKTIKLQKFLETIPIIAVQTEQVTETPLYFEIPLKVLNEEAWVKLLQNFTNNCPKQLTFNKKFVTIGGKFGYKWTILSLVPAEEELIDQLVEFLQMQYLYGKPKQVEATPTVIKAGAANSSIKGRRTLYDPEGKEIGEEFTLKIDCPEKELNVKTEGGRGARKSGLSIRE